MWWIKSKTSKDRGGSPNDWLARILRWSLLLQQTKATYREKDGDTMAADGVRERSVRLASDTERTRREQGGKGAYSRDGYYACIKLRCEI